MIFDTHTHYDDEAFNEDRDELLRSLSSNGIEKVINIGATLKSTQTTVELMEKAKEHVEECGLEGKIETRLSDGLAKINSDEVDSMIAAGMGGNLVIHILSAEEETAKGLKELILQPQSEIGKVRLYLLEEGYQIVKEDMIFEDGKYYPMMKVVRGEREDYSLEDLEYGKLLLREKHPVLKQFLEWEINLQKDILANLQKVNSERTRSRCQELEEKIDQMKTILKERYEYDL